MPIDVNALTIDSQEQVVSTVALVLEKYLCLVREQVTNLNMIYDEKQTFESAVEAYRAKNNIDKVKFNAYPLFAFKRSVLKYATNTAPGHRSISQRVTRRVTPATGPAVNTEVFRTVQAEFDLDFKYYSKKVEDLERFEISYLSEEGVSGIRNLVVDTTPLLGVDMEYFLDPGPLEDKEFQIDNVYYKALSGKVKIRGFYFLVKGCGAHITQINLRILDFLGTIMATDTIIAP